MDEFELIDAVLETLGDAQRSPSVVLGPGDDAAALTPPAGEVLVSSIDALLADVHFPAKAAPELIGYRALMVSLSDLAAMAASPSHVLVSVSVDEADGDPSAWLTGLARGMAEAARATGIVIIGGNLSRGPVAVHVSVHGFAPEAQLLRRDRGVPGDTIYVTGDLGGANAALAQGLDKAPDTLRDRYYRPAARLDAALCLRGHAACAIDISDGLLQDLAHLAGASGLQAELDSARVPVAVGASLEQALSGGDDYELLFTAAIPPPQLDVAVTAIGTLVEGQGLRVDGKPVQATGYQHFS